MRRIIIAILICVTMSECQMSDANIEELDELQQNTLAVPLFPYTLLSSNSYKEPYITIVRSIYGTEYWKRLFKKLDELLDVDEKIVFQYDPNLGVGKMRQPEKTLITVGYFGIESESDINGKMTPLACHELFHIYQRYASVNIKNRMLNLEIESYFFCYKHATKLYGQLPMSMALEIALEKLNKLTTDSGQLKKGASKTDLDAAYTSALEALRTMDEDYAKMTEDPYSRHFENIARFVGLNTY